MGQLAFLDFSSGERNRTGGRCPPDPLGFITLGLLQQGGILRLGCCSGKTARLALTDAINQAGLSSGSLSLRARITANSPNLSGHGTVCSVGEYHRPRKASRLRDARLKSCRISF